MTILVLGGTGYLGPDVVQPLLDAGHTLTLFNRGRSNPTLFPDCEKLVGDRNGDLSALEGRSWDVVIDVPATLPKWVRLSVDLLKQRCRRYVFVSTISVFPDNSIVGLDEDGPTYPDNPELDAVEKMTSMIQYGPMKRRCESIVLEGFKDGATVVRPGLIVGPDDPTDRFTYWPVRIDRGGEVLAPEPRDAPVQFIDGRDLGQFLARLVIDGHSGIYNSTGPSSPLSMAELLHGCRAVTSSNIAFTWVTSEFLLANNVGPFMEMPLWIPGEAMKGFMRIDCSKARSVGLAFRPLAETARDTLLWAKTRPADHKWGAGMESKKESNVLKAWRERS